MGDVVRLLGEVRIMEELAGDTVELIHCTTSVSAIKQLVYAHDLLELNLHLERRFREAADFLVWDRATFKDLDRIRIELITGFSFAFTPPTLLPRYYQKVGHLFQVVGFSG